MRIAMTNQKKDNKVSIDDSTVKRSSHREAREDRQENAKSQIIIQDNLRDGLTFSKRS
jgi:hypothetical protein